MVTRTYLVVGDTDNRNSVGINPDIIFCEVHAILLEVLAAVAKLLPFLLPLGNGFLQCARKVGVFTFVGMDRLLCTFEFDGNALQILALDKGTLCSVSIDAKTILLVFLAGLVYMGLLGLLRLELFLNCALIRLAVLCLASDKSSDGIFKFISDLLRKLQMEPRLLVCLLPQRIERVPEFAGRDMLTESTKRSGPGQMDTHPISSRPIVVLASLASRFA